MSQRPIPAAEPKRRSERVLLRIPIRVQGMDAGSHVGFAEETFTVLVNANGARISLNHAIRPNDRLRVTNLRTHKSLPFRVVGLVAEQRGETPEWGIECLEPDMDFWGISFPEPNAEK